MKKKNGFEWYSKGSHEVRRPKNDSIVSLNKSGKRFVKEYNEFILSAHYFLDGNWEKNSATNLEFQCAKLLSHVPKAKLAKEKATWAWLKKRYLRDNRGHGTIPDEIIDGIHLYLDVKRPKQRSNTRATGSRR